MINSPKSEVKSSKYRTVVRKLFFLLIGLVPIIMYSGTSELFEFNKMLFIYVISSLAGGIWITDVLLNKRKIVYPRFITVTFLLFLASQILSTFFSIDVHTSLFGYYGRFNGGLFSIIAYIILLYTFIQYFSSELLEKYLKFSVFISTIVIFWGLPGKFGYDLSCLLFTGKLNNTCWTDQFRPSERMFSTLGQPNWLGAYLAIHLFIGIYFLISAYKRKSTQFQIIYTLYFFLNFAAVLFTRSRSTFGAVMIALAILPFCLLFVYRRKDAILGIAKVYLSLLIITIFSIAIFQTGIEKIDSWRTYFIRRDSQDTSSVQKSVEPKASKAVVNSGVTDSFDIRKVVWKGAAELGRQYPLFGTGVETFAYSYYFVRPMEHNLTSEWDFLYNKAHNEFLNYFATTGYIGISAYIFMILSVFYFGLIHIIKNPKNVNDSASSDQQLQNKLLTVCLLISYLTILVTNFFGFSTTSVNIFFYLIPGFIFVTFKSNELKNVNSFTPTLARKISSGIIIIFVLYILFFIVRYFQADVAYSQADSLSRSGEYQKAAEEYNKLIRMHYEHVYEDKLSYVLANLAYVAAYQKAQETADNLIKLSEFYNQKSLQASPMNINYWKTSVKNDYLFYQAELDPQYIEKGLDQLKTARTISPTDPKLPYSQALFYSVLEDEEKDADKKLILQEQSIASINEAIKMKSDYRDSYFLKGQLLKKYGKTEEASKVFQFILDHINPVDDEVKKELSELT